MNKSIKNFITPVLIALLILLIAACFITSALTIEKHSEDDCFENIKETTVQLTNMFSHTMEQNQTQLTLFANILAANSHNPDELLQTYMKHFCDTQSFSGVCVHRKDGSAVSYIYHSHEEIGLSFEDEAARLPYTSDVHSVGDLRNQQYVYQAVPIVRNNETIAILYGYIALDTLPSFTSTTEYNGNCQFYIVDGNTGDFMVDEFHRTDNTSSEIKLGNMYDDSMDWQLKRGYSIEKMRDDVKNGKSGYFVLRADKNEEWFYTYYMPIGINNWSMQLTVGETAAFKTYRDIRTILFVLIASAGVCVLALAAMIIIQSMSRRKKDLWSLHKSDYHNAVQSALISAHNNPYFVDHALKIVGEEIKAETVLLLTFEDRIIKQAQYWPSQDKMQAMALIGINIRDDFPIFFDALAAGKTVFFDEKNSVSAISDTAKQIFTSLDVSNILLVPITDNQGLLKGAIAAVNLLDSSSKKTEMIECVTRDFFMAITNLENHNKIKKMGELDYLTGLKNRNSFESELSEYEISEAESLWFMFVDVNGLHELNNKAGHKAGDLMLCTVADIMRKLFGANHTYRLGGDEFAAFLENGTHEEMMNLKYRLTDELVKKGYSVSAGFEGSCKNENRVFDVERLVSAAEKMMYRDKREYYKNNNVSDIRQRI